MKKKLIGILIGMLCIVMLAQTAFASEMPSVSIPVQIVLKGNVPSKPEKFTVKLVAEDAACPMPEGSEDGVYAMTILGKGEKDFPAITYSKVGIYDYTIYQVAGENRKCTYDGTKYHLTVYVTNAEDGGLETTVVLYAEGAEDKVGGVVFSNRYKYEPSDTPQTSDESNFPLYAMLAGGSVLVLALLFLTRKREEA